MGARNTGSLFSVETIRASLGCWGWRFVTRRIPFSLPSFFSFSFSMTRVKKSCRHLEWLMCSTRTLILQKENLAFVPKFLNYNCIIPLGDNLSTNLLVDNDSNSMLCDIEDTSSLTVVELVRHAFLKCTISLDVDNITFLVDFQEGGQRFDSVLPEFLREEVTRSSTIPFWVDHVDIWNRMTWNAWLALYNQWKRVPWCHLVD